MRFRTIRLTQLDPRELYVLDEPNLAADTRDVISDL